MTHYFFSMFYQDYIQSTSKLFFYSYIYLAVSHNGALCEKILIIVTNYITKIHIGLGKLFKTKYRKKLQM